MGDDEAFFRGKGRKNGGEAAGEVGFAGAGWAGEDEVMGAGRGDFEGAFSVGLAFEVSEVVRASW